MIVCCVAHFRVLFPGNQPTPTLKESSLLNSPLQGREWSFVRLFITATTFSAYCGINFILFTIPGNTEFPKARAVYQQVPFRGFRGLIFCSSGPIRSSFSAHAGIIYLSYSPKSE